MDGSKEDVSAGYPIRHRRQFTRNQNLVQEISADSETYVYLPRPGEGVCFVGRVKGAFRVENKPNWIDDYLALRRQQGLDCANQASHVGDVVQCWSFDFGSTVRRPWPS